MKRLISCLLVVCMLLGTLMLVGCPAPDDGGTTTTTKPNSGGATPPEWADTLDTDAIKKELGGQTLTISAFETYDYEIYAEEDSKDALDQLIFKRNKKIEERFGVTINPDITRSAGENDLSSQYTYVQTELRGMAPSFDLIAMMAYQSGKLITQKYYRDWRSAVPYARESLTAGDAWWPADMNKNSTVGGRQFVAISDMSITLTDLSFMILFNETLATSNNIASSYGAATGATYETMYDIVKAGEWTLDSMITMTKDLWQDNDKAGSIGMVDAEDVIGFHAMAGTELDNFAYSFGYSYIKNDGVSDPEIGTPPATFDTMVGKMRSFFNDNNGAHKGGLDLTYVTRGEAFASGHIVFYTCCVDELKKSVIKGMEQDYGVLPYPKLNAEQSSYITGTSDNITVLSVPRYTTGKNLKLAGAMTVALSAETRKSINDTYYEMIVKHDSGFVNRSALEMLDKIMTGRVFDLSLYHYDDLSFSNETHGRLGTFFRYLMNTATNQTASGAWESAGSVCKNLMRDLIEDYASIK